MKKMFLVSLTMIALCGFCFAKQAETAEDTLIVSGEASEDAEPDFLYYYL